MYLGFMKTFYFSNFVNTRKQSDVKNAADMTDQDEVQTRTLVNKIKKKLSGFIKCTNWNSIATTGFSRKTLPLRAE
jgi:hypothetical protein